MYLVRTFQANCLNFHILEHHFVSVREVIGAQKDLTYRPDQTAMTEQI